MGLKHSSSSSACTSSTIDSIRTKNINKLTRQLSKRASSKNTKKIKSQDLENGTTPVELLQLDINKDDQQRSALHFAAIEGDATIIVALYEYMHTVDVSDTSGRTPLHYAAIVGNNETMTTLLLCNPDTNRLSKDGTTAVHEAIIHNHPITLTHLLQHGADTDILFQDYLPPLILAVYLQHKTIVELLIRLGIDPNLTDAHMGRSSLHYAAYFHHDIIIFNLLLSSTIHHSVDINARDVNGASVLDYARANIHGSSAIVDLLLQLGVFDPDRGQITIGMSSLPSIEIEKPQVKIFQSPKELSSLKKTGNDKEKTKKKISMKFKWTRTRD